MARPWSATAASWPPLPRRPGIQRRKNQMGGGRSRCGAGRTAHRRQPRRREQGGTDPAPTAALPWSPASAWKASRRSGPVSEGPVSEVPGGAPSRPALPPSGPPAVFPARAWGQCPRTVVPGWCVGRRWVGGLGSPKRGGFWVRRSRAVVRARGRRSAGLFLRTLPPS